MAAVVLIEMHKLHGLDHPSQLMSLILYKDMPSFVNKQGVKSERVEVISK